MRRICALPTTPYIVAKQRNKVACGRGPRQPTSTSLCQKALSGATDQRRNRWPDLDLRGTQQGIRLVPALSQVRHIFGHNNRLLNDIP